MKRTLLIPLVATVLSGCQSAPQAGGAGPLLYEAVRGRTIVLNKPVTVVANQARAYLQGGVEVTAQQVSRDSPHCEVEVRTLSPAPTVVQPDRFTVTRIRNPEEGSEGFGTAFMSAFRSGTTKYTTEMRVKSEKQPDVLQITCSNEMDTTRGHHLTVRQFNSAVGGYLSIQ